MKIEGHIPRRPLKGSAEAPPAAGVLLAAAFCDTVARGIKPASGFAPAKLRG